MHFIYYLLLRLYPFWAIPVSLAFLQLGLHFRRKVSSSQYGCWAVTLFLWISSGLWIFFRGDLNSDSWVRAVFQDL